MRNSINVADLFERELRNRGLTYSLDAESGRHAVAIGETSMLISLDNLQRDVNSDSDVGRVCRFVDAIELTASNTGEEYSAKGLFWTIENNDYEPKADFYSPLSDRLDRVLIHESEDGRLLTWVTPPMLETLQIAPHEASRLAFENLGHALSNSKIEYEEIDGTRLGYLNTQLEFKASLILAPNVREIIGPVLGWPLLAVIPDRNFLYLWDAADREFCGRVGSVVVREYSKAAYPLSTEVYEISDAGVRAIGEFPSQD
jgi:hypothetical protein